MGSGVELNPSVLPPRPRKRPLVIHRGPLTCWVTPWQHKGADSLTVTCKASCDLDDKGVPRLRDEADPPMGDLHWDDQPEASLCYPSDFAIFKPRADVMVVGWAHAPNGSSDAGHVHLRFGDDGRGFERRVAVFGARRWRGGGLGGEVASTPDPFDKLPLRYEIAFGGAGYRDNPVGCGWRASKDVDGVARMPHLEDPEQLLLAPADKPTPAALGPIAPLWPERWSKIGNYDAKWLANRWPYFPDDFDWEHFQAAPSAQRLDFLRGDEPFELTGMRPGGATLQGRLPAISALCFVCRRNGETLTLTPLRLNLDTVFFDTEQMTLQLLWRGLLAVSAPEAPEIAALYITTEPLDEELSPEAASGRLGAELATRKPPTGTAVGSTAPANDDGAAAVPTPGGSVRDKLEGAGVPVEWFGSDLRPAAVKPERGAIEVALRADGAQDEEVQRLLAVLAHEQERAKRLRADAEAKLARQGDLLDGVDWHGADLSTLDLAGRSLVGANLIEANLRGADLGGADLSGAKLAGADLTGARLAQANLTGAELFTAVLEEASLDGAELQGCNLMRVRASSACFAGVHGEGARFVEADLQGAVFEDSRLPTADFTRAKLDDATFVRAALPQARFYDASGHNVSFVEANLAGARADGLTLHDSSFRQARASSSVWDEADLDRTDWFGATLTGASYCGSSCQGCIFTQADLRGALLRDATLTEAAMLKTNLMEASLEGAKLERTDLRGANLYRAETWRADLAGALLDGAFLKGSKLEG